MDHSHKKYVIRADSFALSEAEDKLKKLLAAAGDAPFSCWIHLHDKWFPDQYDSYGYPCARFIDIDNGQYCIALRIGGEAKRDRYYLDGDDGYFDGDETSYASAYIDMIDKAVVKAKDEIARSGRFSDEVEVKKLTNEQYIRLFDVGRECSVVSRKADWTHLSLAGMRYTAQIAEILYGGAFVVDADNNDDKLFIYGFLCPKGMENDVKAVVADFDERLKKYSVYANDDAHELVDSFDYTPAGVCLLEFAARRLGCRNNEIESEIAYWRSGHEYED